MPEPKLSNNCQNISLILKESAKCVAEKSMSKVCQCQRRPNYVEQPIVPMWVFPLTEHGTAKS